MASLRSWVVLLGTPALRPAPSRAQLAPLLNLAAGRLELRRLTQLLNHYLTEMSKIAQQFGGTIDKYIGNAILIFFGDPDTKGVKADAVVCVKMAIAMREKCANWIPSGEPRV